MTRFRFILLLFLAAMSMLPVSAKRPTGKERVRVGVLLPLKEKTTRGAKMVEFYQGLLMAVDSMKHAGLNIDIVALHSGNSANDMDHLLASNSFADCDVLFGSLDGAQLPLLADYCDIHGVRLVVPFSSPSASVLSHPTSYMVSAPRNIVQEEAAWIVQNQFGNDSFVLVDTHENNDEGQQFVEQLRGQLSSKGIYMRPLPIDGDEMAYFQAFNSLRKNIVVLNSPSIKALNKFLPKLKEYLRNHPDVKVSLLGYPDWQTYTSQLLADFYQFDTYIYSTFYRNPLEGRNSEFERAFIHHFRRPMTETYPRYALMGFDLGYFFLRGLSIYGDGFERNLLNVPARPFQHPLRFGTLETDGGYVNGFVQLIHYTPLQTIELLTRTVKP